MGPRIGPATNRCCLDIYFTDLPCWTSTTNLMQGRAEETTVRSIWTNIVYMYVNAPNNKRPPKKPKKPNYLIRTYDESYTTQHSSPPIGPQQVVIQCFRCPALAAASPLFATSPQYPCTTATSDSDCWDRRLEVILRRRKANARHAASIAPPTRPSGTKRGSGSSLTASLVRNPIQSTYSIRVDGPYAEIERITPGGQTPVAAAKSLSGLPSVDHPVRPTLTPRRLPRPASVSTLATKSKSTWLTPN